jgi:hypothetical protein
MDPLHNPHRSYCDNDAARAPAPAFFRKTMVAELHFTTARDGLNLTQKLAKTTIGWGKKTRYRYMSRSAGQINWNRAG